VNSRPIGRRATICFQAIVEAISEIRDSTGLGHTHGKHQAGFAVESGHDFRRVHIAGQYIGDVFEAQSLCRAGQGQRHGTNFLDRLEFAGRFHEDSFVPQQRAGSGGQRIAGLDHLHQHVRRNTQFSQPGVGNFDINALFLLSPYFDLGGLFDQQQFVSDILGNRLELPVGEPVAAQRDDDAENVSEFVVDQWSDNLLGQVRSRVRHFVAQILPDRLHVHVMIEHLHLDDGELVSGFGKNSFHFRHFTDAFFELIGHQPLDLIRCATGQDSDDNGGADREFRILETRHRYKITHTESDDQDNEQSKGAIVADAPLGCIHRACSSIRETV
jgi:hypothetical protein